MSQSYWITVKFLLLVSQWKYISQLHFLQKPERRQMTSIWKSLPWRLISFRSDFTVLLLVYRTLICFHFINLLWPTGSCVFYLLPKKEQKKTNSVYYTGPSAWGHEDSWEWGHFYCLGCWFFFSSYIYNFTVNPQFISPFSYLYICSLWILPFLYPVFPHGKRRTFPSLLNYWFLFIYLVVQVYICAWFVSVTYKSCLFGCILMTWELEGFLQLLFSL